MNMYIVNTAINESDSFDCEYTSSVVVIVL